MQELKPRTATTYFSKRLADVVTHPPRKIHVEALLEVVCAVYFTNFCVVREIRGRGDEMHAVDVFMICFDFLEMRDAPNRIDRLFPTEQDQIPPPPPPEQYAHVMSVFVHNMQERLDEISPKIGNLDINDPGWSFAETQHGTAAPERTAQPDVEEYLRQMLPEFIVQFIMRKDRAATN